ncbi:hypothetical protein [Rhodoferax sp.]|nr:hypothetical protein [Rhodoferax sp.]NMM21811.1 hypothetical protein [Rhodoferax sp.]
MLAQQSILCNFYPVHDEPSGPIDLADAMNAINPWLAAVVAEYLRGK